MEKKFRKRFRNSLKQDNILISQKKLKKKEKKIVEFKKKLLK